MSKAIDLDLVLKLMTAIRPAPVAPIAPIEHDFTKGSESAFGMAKDIEYLTKAVDSIEKKIDKITETHVTVADYNDHIKSNEKIFDGHDMRLRSVEQTVTKIMTWGTIILTILTLAQLALRLFVK